ncbi:MAG: NAD(P)H-hydrate dehydratase [Dysgonamonadaceae bacterium]|jgi:NAD(P)H-hydrate epimerase|nr:NAD(P)H-hydrate dehydratase [Dysgonamonadaceae bacterium]
MKTIDDSQMLTKLINMDLSGINIERAGVSYFSVETEDIMPLIPIRDPFAHKGNFGHALLVAGSRGKMGAAVLSAKACLRTGAGLLTVHIPACGETIMQTAFPEAMTATDGKNDYIAKFVSIDGYDAIAIGPGIGLQKQTAAVLYDLLKNSHKPTVIDADALNLLAKDKTSLRLIPPNSILTPHPKEFDRLAGVSANSYERLQKAIQLAENLNVYLILKGGRTAICTPQKQCYFNSTGNPGMATAGSGDVLTGIILGLLAQSYAPFDAAIAGVFLHGRAGDIAADKCSEESIIASDVIDHLGTAFKF